MFGMKYIISESKLEKAIYKHIENTFDSEDINWVNQEEWDEETDQYQETENAITFYFGDYEGEDDGIFRWYDCDYFELGSKAKELCPIVQMEHPYDIQLNGYFGKNWHEPFKKWFTKNFFLPIKTIE